MKTMSECSQPFTLIIVELCDGNVAHFSPRLVLECVIIQKLASKNEGNGDHFVECSLRDLKRAVGR